MAARRASTARTTLAPQKRNSLAADERENVCAAEFAAHPRIAGSAD
jgi:hypothetical protein